MAKEKTLVRHLQYKTPWEGKETRHFWLVINSMKSLILYSHQNDDELNELATAAIKAKTLKLQ